MNKQLILFTSFCSITSVLYCSEQDDVIVKFVIKEETHKKKLSLKKKKPSTKTIAAAAVRVTPDESHKLSDIIKDIHLPKQESVLDSEKNDYIFELNGKRCDLDEEITSSPTEPIVIKLPE